MKRWPMVFGMLTVANLLNSATGWMTGGPLGVALFLCSGATGALTGFCFFASLTRR